MVESETKENNANQINLDNGNGDRVYFAQTNFRNERKSFGIKRNDRTKHAYIIGKTGMGKTTLLENMTIQDIQNGEGVGIVDPHGGFAEKMLDFVPQSRLKDVIYFCPHDTNWPIAFNVMEDVGAEHRHLVASELMSVFKKIWPDVWSPRMEYILNNAILALLEYPNSTLLGINRMLSDKEYRKEVVSKITDPAVKAFWEQEFARYTERFMTEAGAAIQNKVGQFISNPLIRNIIGQPKSRLDMRKVIDQKKILIMNLSKGRIGETNSQLIGAMLITKLYLAAMSRVDVSEEQRSDFYLYVDEFQNFATESFKDILSEARKYRLDLILAHQYIAQMDEKVRDAVFGNVGTLIIFRVGAYDAELLEQEFGPEFTANDIVNLGFANIYLKLMIDGVASRPFSAMTLSPIALPEKSFKEEIIKSSQEQYATPKQEVEKNISEWHAPVKNNAETSAENIHESPAKDFVPRERAANAPQLFDAVCSSCGKKTQVPFKPDNKRPVYCLECKERYIGNKDKAKQEAVFAPRSIPRVKAPVRHIPSFEEGEVVRRPPASKTISLEFLKKESISDRKKPKAPPNLESLKKALEEALSNAPTENKEQKNVSQKEEPKKEEEREKKFEEDKKVIKPGESVKF